MIFFSFFREFPLSIIPLSAIVGLVTSYPKQLGAEVGCSHTIEVILSYDRVSLLLIAVFRNEDFYGAET